ncbi:FtsB family cell division protein [Streptomyces sp. NBC_01304]|uniref:FtsB family cell division protein n=1 Tax=Streptomyces sp. NBC_01304 TaxID=2903818 RepID=UPI002E104C9B|nr:septum formation initiator family protein [Streptomyces sp. NBC_01304]
MRGRAARLARLFPAGPATAARTPFVLLVVLLLGGGLIALLVLNSALNEGSFRLSKLKKETTELTDTQQELEREVDGYSAPDALERRARELGMVPGGSPAFLNPDGTVRGAPGAAQADPSAMRTPSAPAAAPIASAPPASAKPLTKASAPASALDSTPASATPQAARTPLAPQPVRPSPKPASAPAPSTPAR